MQNISMWTPSKFLITNFPGSTSETLTSSRTFVRTQSGYTGAKPSKLIHPKPIHAYTFNCHDFRLERSGNSTNTQGKLVQTYQGPILAPTATSLPNMIPAFDSTALYNECLAKLGEKVRGSVDLSVDLAERHKTAKMVNLTYRFLEAFRNGVQKESARYYKSKLFSALAATQKAKLIANAWLEIQYGWKPMLSTIYGLADESIRRVSHAAERYRVSAKGIYNPDKIVMPTYGGNVTYPIDKADLQVSVSIGCYIQQPSWSLDKFTSLNPYSLAWELLPYSFVVDWFYNLGGYLRSMETAVVYDNRFVSGWRTDYMGGSVTIKRQTMDRSQGLLVDNTTGYYKLTSINRTFLTQYPAPRLPSLKAELGSSRMLSAAALLAGFLSTRKH
ncbi:maturation protein [ssRNA phage Gephyllon.2_5]|uniref:Maturation protein n=2 Tax=Fiersviridae TaxID=2842319 RepID=A0A8S5KZ61_9VIRU|nr:maturation protein [ssRNA phage Gephyllon.2_5]QDH86647.1 MAG: hypothetical protein H2BulkLitter11460_000002 [Leviviridae sp.]DAD50357.1 TPA_asm: maturation protein [ssRNA phage Gephyllon.2_5]